MALRDVLGLLERHDRLLVLAALDVGAPEASVILDPRRRVFALGFHDDVDRFDEVVERRVEVAQLGPDQSERREVRGILRLALGALRIDDAFGRSERRAEIARADESVSDAWQTD